MIVLGILSWFNVINVQFILFSLLYIYFILKAGNFNKKDFDSKFKASISIPSFFIYLRNSLFFTSVFLFYKHFEIIFDGADYTSYKYTSVYKSFVINNFVQNLIAIIVIFLLVYYIFCRKRKSDAIFIKIDNTFNRILKVTDYGSELEIFLKSFVFFIIILIFGGLSIYFSDIVICYIDELFILQKFYPFNFVNDFTSSKNGIYLATVVTSYLFIFFLKVMHNRTNHYYNFFDELLIIFFLIICCLGIFEGLYSIFNIINNAYLVNGDFLKLLSNKSIGYIQIKITSLILMWNLLKFTFIFVFKGNFLEFFKDGFFNTKDNSHNHDSMYYNSFKAKTLGGFLDSDSNYYNNYYFNQVGFYVINIFAAEYLISVLDFNSMANILFIFLPIMVDDYLVMHVYFEKTGSMDNWHRIKKNLFNVALFILSAASLSIGGHIITLTIYIVFSMLFIVFYLINESKNPSNG
ncbi:MAG: hypothetical protein V4613_05590 [Bacteroidota bacterium]